MDFNLQYVLRVLNFVLDQLVYPLLDELGSKTQNELLTENLKETYISLFKPFWMQMKISVLNTSVDLKIN